MAGTNYEARWGAALEQLDGVLTDVKKSHADVFEEEGLDSILASVESQLDAIQDVLYDIDQGNYDDE